MADPVVDEVYERRLERGWSIRELERRAGVGGGAGIVLSRIERGMHSPSLATLRKLLEALDLDLVVVAKERR